VVAVVVTGGVMSILDTTIVNVALDSLSRDLHSSLDNVQWVVTAYLLSLAAVVPASGWIARRYGTRRVYLTAIALFTIGSALCGMASSIGELVVFRVVQGIGGGLILPVGQMIVVRAAGPTRLARVISVMQVPIVLAPVWGPTVGGLLIDTVGWRWIFFVNVPIGIAAVLAGARRLPANDPESSPAFDLPGLLMVAVGLVAVTYGLANIGQTSAQGAAPVAAPLGVGVFLIAMFVRRALRVPRPLLDVRLYRNLAFSAAALSIVMFTMATYGSMILLPLYFQVLRHKDAMITGLLLAPRGIGASVGSLVSAPLIDRFGCGISAAIGGIVGCLCAAPLVLLGGHTSFWMAGAAMLVGGFGNGLASTPSMTAALRVVEPHQVSDATPQINILSRTGGSIGTAMVTVLLQDRLTQAHGSYSAQSRAFSTTFQWVPFFSGLAVLPSFVLIYAERRRAGTKASVPALDAQPVIGQVLEDPA
jgi:EmrB/QacA subfamily drug resistance transporter